MGARPVCRLTRLQPSPAGNVRIQAMKTLLRASTAVAALALALVQPAAACHPVPLEPSPSNNPGYHEGCDGPPGLKDGRGTPGTPPAREVDEGRPAITALRVRPQPVVLRRVPGARAAGRIRFELSEAAAVTIRIRKIGRGGRPGPWVRVISQPGVRGLNTAALKRAWLTSGRYRADATATDRAGNRSREPSRATFSARTAEPVRGSRTLGQLAQTLVALLVS